MNVKEIQVVINPVEITYAPGAPLSTDEIYKLGKKLEAQLDQLGWHISPGGWEDNYASGCTAMFINGYAE